MFPVYRVVDDLPGARASRPHKSWHNFALLPHLDRPATAPRLSFDPAVAVPADVVATCNVALMLSKPHKE